MLKIFCLSKPVHMVIYIGMFQECVNALNKQYHPACFLCYHCKKPIGGGQFHLEDGNAYCENGKFVNIVA